MADLETLLGEARRKSAAETDAAQLRSMLNRLDSELVELNEVRQQVSRRAARSGGLMGRFRRDRGDPQVDEMELMRVDASIAALESRRASGQHRLRTVEQEAHGAELARAMLGAEMTRRTSALAADDPSLARLAEIDERREGLVQRRDRATSMSALAGELLLWVDGAERADDGTDVLYVELNSASRKREELQRFVRPNALIARTNLKDRLEGFRTLEGPNQDCPPLGEIAALVVDDHVADYEVWLHRVRVALSEALEWGVGNEEATRGELTEIDKERLAILTSTDTN